MTFLVFTDWLSECPFPAFCKFLFFMRLCLPEQSVWALQLLYISTFKLLQKLDCWYYSLFIIYNNQIKLAYLSSSKDIESSSCKTVCENSSSPVGLASEFADAKNLRSPSGRVGDLLVPSIPGSSKIGGNWGVELLARRCLDGSCSLGEADRKPSFVCPMFLKKFAIDFPIPLLWETFPFSYT